MILERLGLFAIVKSLHKFVHLEFLFNFGVDLLKQITNNI